MITRIQKGVREVKKEERKGRGGGKRIRDTIQGCDNRRKGRQKEKEEDKERKKERKEKKGR